MTRPRFWLLAVVPAVLIGFVWLGQAPADDKPSSKAPTLDTGTLNEDVAAKLQPKKAYSPYAGRNYPTRVFWGDTHLHTRLSFDAGAFGNKLGMDDAYNFAKGEEVVASGGQRARLSRPLDFLVISDHSDGMGFYQGISGGDPRFMAADDGRRWNRMIKEGKGVDATLEMIGAFSQGKMAWKTNDPAVMKPIWQKVVDAAERHNDPGTFTAFIGYEWTSLIKGNNLHRVVIYRDDGTYARQTLPYTNEDSSDPEDFWKALQAYEDKTGGNVLAIAHNGNMSNGLMFAETTIGGKPLDAAYCRTRARWEPLYEATQIKGDGEAHPLLSPDDEFADYETWAFGNLDLSAKKTPDMLKYEYARSALKMGLEYEAKLGVNPFQFGMIGSTDSHTSLCAVEEESFFGKHAGSEPKPERIKGVFFKSANGTIMEWQETSSGFAGVWATENTRAAIYDAMARREVYATTGSRMAVRIFGGFDFEPKHAKTRNPAGIGYSLGVPMGGEMKQAPAGKSATFLVAALKDHLGANLDRIQIVKGWLGADGKAQEKVYDVVWSDMDTRTVGADGKVPAVGNTVDVATATWTNTIGVPELVAVWKDPAFDASQRAFYYMRVLEIPTPRWTTYDAVRFKVSLDPATPKTTQERAYSSPIWYSPAR